MRRIGFIAFALLGTVALCAAQGTKPDSLVVVLKGGHQRTFPMAEISRIDFRNGSMLLTRAGRQETFFAHSTCRFLLALNGIVPCGLSFVI